LETGLATAFMTVCLSFIVVRSLMIGSWMTGTSDM